MTNARTAASIDGKSIIITGGGSGIGRATAILCARNGAQVTIGDIDVAGAAETVDMVVEQGGAAQSLKVDVAREADVQAMVAAAVSRFGRLDAAFNNSGVRNTQKKLADVSLDEWTSVHNVNLLGVFLCIKHEIRAMLTTGGGAIVNNASAAGLVAIPFAADYVASKHGVIGLTKTAAVDYGADHIRVNALAPGVCRTEMFEKALVDNPALENEFTPLHPLGRLALPKEMAEAAMWLMSDASSFVHGACLAVDGGYVAV